MARGIQALIAIGGTMNRKDVVVIGGPNGAGKTTWAIRRLPEILNIREFVNADEIARGLSPLDPEGSTIAAGRVMINRLNELVSAGHNFAFETTCSGRRHVRLLERCRAADYRTTLVFLWLPSAKLALARVAQRVSEGGHRIPSDVVVRRYASGLRNMRLSYLPLADSTTIRMPATFSLPSVGRVRRLQSMIFFVGNKSSRPPND